MGTNTIMDEVRHGDAIEITDTGGPYYECPNCKNSNITRAFSRCVDCGIKLIWRKGK